MTSTSLMPCQASVLPDAAEMRRLGLAPLSRRFWIILAVNTASLALLLGWPLQTTTGRALALAMLLPAALAFGLQAHWLWSLPSRRRLGISAALNGAGLVVAALAVKKLAGQGAEREWLTLVFLLLGLALNSGVSFLCLYRRQQIDARRRELDERAQALAAQAQLAQAQIQPHFLFNSLASLTHWVRVQDGRAAPLLDALTSYLRATLPLFNRAQLSLGEELAAVREYLAVMQARLGDRLQVEIEVPEALQSVQLPPALLLTLVENAIEHGVMPKLGSVLLRVQAEQQGQRLLIRVADDGPGLPATPNASAPGRGIGLSNSRLRLAQAFGAEASLTLTNSAETGGCVATLSLPLQASVAQGEHTQ